MKLKRIEVHFEKGIVRLDQEDGPEIQITLRKCIQSSYGAAEKEEDKPATIESYLKKQIKSLEKALSKDSEKPVVLTEQEIAKSGLTYSAELNRRTAAKAKKLGEQRFARLLAVCTKFKNELESLEI